MELRPATPDDVTILQEWRNDPDTRSMSRRQHHFTREDTATWVFQEGRSFLIAWNDGIPVGFVSFAPYESSSEFEVSIVVAPNHRGYGYGKAMLALSRQLYRNNTLHAEVKESNTASTTIFKACGFFVHRSENGMLYLKTRTDFRTD